MCLLYETTPILFLDETDLLWVPFIYSTQGRSPGVWSRALWYGLELRLGVSALLGPFLVQTNENCLISELFDQPAPAAPFYIFFLMFIVIY